MTEHRTGGAFASATAAAFALALCAPSVLVTSTAPMSVVVAGGTVATVALVALGWVRPQVRRAEVGSRTT